MSRLDEIKNNLETNAYAFGGERLAQEDVEYLLNEVERLKQEYEFLINEMRNERPGM